MGLDITAYQQWKLLGPVGDADEDYDWKTEVRPYVDPEFPVHAEGVAPNSRYGFELSFRFRAGSYSGYSAWREELATFAGYPKVEHRNFLGNVVQTHTAGAWAAIEGPFWELIHFSDCEGTIGPIVGKKLAHDFEVHRAAAAKVGGYFFDRYQEWEKAFQMAADGGAVCFH